MPGLSVQQPLIRDTGSRVDPRDPGTAAAASSRSGGPRARINVRLRDYSQTVESIVINPCLEFVMKVSVVLNEPRRRPVPVVQTKTMILSVKNSSDIEQPGINPDAQARCTKGLIKGAQN